MKTLPKIKIGQKPSFVTFARDVDFYELFQKIEQEFDTCFIFESLGEEGKFSRYSIIGFDPQHVISARENVLRIDSERYPVDNPYDALRQIMPQQTITREYAGGLVGYLSYDAVNYFEPTIHVKVHDKFDQFLFGVYTDGLIYDKLTNEVIYFYYEKNRSNIISAVMQKKPKRLQFHAKFIRDTLTKEEHATIVDRVKEKILSGNTFQCEVGFKSEYHVSGNSLEIYKRLRQVNPSPFMYYLKFGNPSAGSGQGKQIIGASPELLFSLREGEMTSVPLAGTTRRGKKSSEDQKLVRELLHDPKERAEHTMVVDMHRNDIGKVAQFGTVKVRNLMTVKRFSHVQHIASEVVGLIRSTEDMFSSLASNFPMPTVCGTPRVETVNIIDANEPVARGPYGGGVGHFGFNGDCTFALALRSFFVSGNYGYAQTSGGIVADSVPDKEYKEIENKLAAMKTVLDMNFSR
jgi:anthranilate synthase component I